MSFKLIALGHKAPAWIEEGCTEYRQRLPKEWRFEEQILKAERRNDHTSSAIIKAREAKRIEQSWQDSTIRIALDERGRLLTSQELAIFIQNHHDKSERIACVIGGTDGLDSQIVNATHITLALSRFTLTHELARLILMEQLYRASTILSGHPYHRDE